MVGSGRGAKYSESGVGVGIDSADETHCRSGPALLLPIVMLEDCLRSSGLHGSYRQGLPRGIDHRLRDAELRQQRTVDGDPTCFGRGFSGPDPKLDEAWRDLASPLAEKRRLATRIQASALARVFSKSLASLPQRPGQASLHSPSTRQNLVAHGSIGALDDPDRPPIYLAQPPLQRVAGLCAIGVDRA